jgi:hypothetical protein
MPTTTKSITGRKKRSSTLIPDRNLQELQGKQKGKAVNLLKERKAKTLTYHQHSGLMQNLKD